jgi:hypothetical protein
MTCPGSLIFHVDGTIAGCTEDDELDGCRGLDLGHESDPKRCFEWSGQVSAFGSGEADRLLQPWQRAANDFYIWASSMDAAQKNGENPYSHWKPLEEARARARVAILAIEEQVRVELQGVEMHGVAPAAVDGPESTN